MLERGWQQTDDIEACDFYWRPINYGSEGYQKLDKRKKPVLWNHFENIDGICTKTKLIHSLKKYYENNDAAQKYNYTVFDSTPTTFVIAAEGSESVVHAFERRFRELSKGTAPREKMPMKHCQ